MNTHTNRTNTVSRLLLKAVVIPLLLVGTKGVAADDAKSSPPVDLIKAQLRSLVPKYLKVDALETEVVSQSEGTSKMSFKVKLVTQEDLFIEEAPAANTSAELDGLPEELRSQLPPAPKYLKRTQKESSTGNAYGVFSATRRLDNWNLKDFEIESGLDQFGKPRGSFDASFDVGGTPEAEAAKKRYDDKLAELKSKAGEIAAKKKEEEQALLKKQAEMTAAVKKQEADTKAELERTLLAASAPGVTYEGTVSDDGERQGVRLKFLEQNASIVRCEMVNPARLSDRQVFVGELQVTQDPDQAHLKLGSEKEQDLTSPSSWVFYQWSGTVSLRFTEKNWEGTGAFRGHRFSFKLVPAKKTASPQTSSSAGDLSGTVGLASAPQETNPNSSEAGAVPTQQDGNWQVVFSKPLPAREYRSETVQDFAEALLRAFDDTQRANGRKGMGGFDPALSTTLANYNQQLLGQPVHFTGKFEKISKNILTGKKIMLVVAPKTYVAAAARVGEQNSTALLQAGDEVELVGTYNNLAKNLSDKYTLEVDAGEIVAIRRPKQ